MAKVRNAWIVLSILIFMWSLCGPAFNQDDFKGGIEAGPDGWLILLFGYFCLLSGSAAWFANPLLFFAWLFFFLKRGTVVAVTSMLALVLGATSLLLHEYTDGSSTHEILIYSINYWFWILSIAIMLIAGVIDMISGAIAKVPD